MSGYPDGDADLFLELVRERLASQADALGGLDTKLGIYLSTSCTLISVLFAVYALQPDEFDSLSLGLVAASALLWAFITVIALHGIQHRPFKSGPTLDYVFNLEFSEDERVLKWRVANTFWHDYNANASLVTDKGVALTRSLILLVSQTVLLVVALVVVAVSGASESTSRHSEYPAAAAGAVPAGFRVVSAAPALARSRSCRDSLSRGAVVVKAGRCCKDAAEVSSNWRYILRRHRRGSTSRPVRSGSREADA
jgi:hypothetical protein